MNVRFSLQVLTLNWERINVINSEVYDNAGRQMDFESIQDEAVKLVNEFKGRVRLFNSRGEEVVSWNYNPSLSENVCSLWDKDILQEFIEECSK